MLVFRKTLSEMDLKKKKGFVF